MEKEGGRGGRGRENEGRKEGLFSSKHVRKIRTILCRRLTRMNVLYVSPSHHSSMYIPSTREESREIVAFLLPGLPGGRGTPML